ncbi:glutamate racemase [Candidatus Uhrbacteria bacterium]|nr:glutamate racemase [Candidatus Uhrbacteria bacterium]
MSIGIFDSGLGGLTVAKAVMEVLPREKIIYFGDTARGPYGNKSPEVIAKYAHENAEFLFKKKVQAIVVGCNTASAVAGLELRKHFPKIPIFEVITPAVREALRVTRQGRIGVIGTRTTIRSGAYAQWFRSCVGQACPLFVPLVEGGKIEEAATQEVARHYLTPLKRAKVDTLVLGCTHYPFLKPLLQEIMGRGVKLVDSAQTVAREVAMLRNSKFEIRNSKLPAHQFYVSKKTPRFQELAERWLDTKITLKLAKL